MKRFAYLSILLSLCVSCSPELPENKLPERVPMPLTDSALHKEKGVLPKPAELLTIQDTADLEKRFIAMGLVNVNELDTSVRVELKYGTSDNFMQRDMYGGLKRAYLPCDVAIKLCNAQYYLRQVNASLRLLVFDAARPLSIQQLIWDSVQLRPYEKYLYISPPDQISLHNYGAAVDVSVYDAERGQVCDMGTPFDFFGKLAQPRYEAFYLGNGDLTASQVENRRILTQCMRRAGFYPIATEWWHFNATNKWLAAKRYSLIE